MYTSDGYSELVKKTLSVAKSNGLTAGNPVFVEIILDVPIGRPPTLDVFVTADNSIPTFYKRGLLWLIDLEGSPFNGVFRSCSTSMPDDAVWAPIFSMNEVKEPTFRTANADFLKQQISSIPAPASNVSTLGAIYGSTLSFNPTTLVYEPTNSPSELDLDAGNF